MTRGPIEDIHGLTEMQRAMLVRCVAHPDRPLYMGQWWALLDGDLDQETFCDAWHRVVARHSALRSGVHWEIKKDPFQVVLAAPAFAVERLDWSGCTDWRSDLEALLGRDRADPFDLKRPPLIRVRLITLAPARRLLVWTRHHLVVDGWSLGEILDEVLALYAGRPVPPAVPFRRYVDWARGRDPAAARTYWSGHLAGFESNETIRNPAGTAPDIAERSIDLSADVTARLLGLSRDERLTLSTLVEGAWAMVLARAGGADDILFGCVETVRPPELLGDLSAHLVGPQVAVLPCRVRLDGTTLRQWLSGLQVARTQGRDAGPVGLDAVRDMLGLPRDALPLRSLLAVQTYPLDLAAAFRGAGVELIESGDVTLPDMPLNLMVEVGASILLRLMFDHRHVAPVEAEQYLDMLATALERIPDGLDRPADALDVLSGSRLRQIEACLTGAALPPPAGTVVDLVLARIHAQPDAPAIVTRDGLWSYAELGARAAGVAAQLRARGVGRGDRVGLLLGHRPDAIAAILGIHFAGAAYVPIDPDAPPERRALVLETAGPAAVVTSRSSASGIVGRPVVAIEDVIAAPDSLETDGLPSRDDEAYLIFTSGSSGRPKGVSVGHDNLSYHVAANAAENHDLPIRRFLLTFPLFFDGSVTGIFCTLADGGALVLPTEAETRDPDALAALVRATDASHVCMTPSLWALLLDAAGPLGFTGLRMAKVAAEPCPPTLVREHAARAPAAVLCNEYGPTEATVWVSVERCRSETVDASVAIGRPLPGTRLHVVDARRRPCPFGTVGELVVAGPAVARAYVGAEPGVSLRWLDAPFRTGRDAASCYRTGDRVALGFDGRLFFHGRQDRQIKVSGYRVELGEIEAVLLAQPGIREAAVVAESIDGRPERLVAHLAGSAAEADDETLRRRIGERLPTYMLPQAFVRHGRLPRTGSGKIDTAALPPACPPQRRVEPPAGALEEKLAAIWADLVGVPVVGRHDDFFALGGSSLVAMQVVARIRRDLGLPAMIADLFEAPQLARLAERLGERVAVDATGGPALSARRRTRVELPS
ncbi:non-ribosomal peptide synthetase [Rhodoplanes roseus]|uniref:Non-ribosomal peptide synthetase n=1 Tax=Rhodoplanes roseus TaxID=29409 RepID=A0A327KW42_9BRAD|nr:non-ribosomal peptide synthetase [Rhodoplanes roseus]RAI39578.1 non-ribosomal peptide synthetase [Rhodoplanes roseus]